MRIRELKNKDAVYMTEWMQNKEINKYFQFNLADISIVNSTKFIENVYNNKNALHLAVVNDNDDYVGTISLKNIDFKNQKAEYAIALREVAMGEGYARFATDAILYIAFYILELNRIYLCVLDENIRANKFYEKYGFIYEGKFFDDLYIRGKLKNVNWYRILKREYRVHQDEIEELIGSGCMCKIKNIFRKL